MDENLIRTERIIETKKVRLRFSYIIWIPLILTVFGLLIAVPMMDTYRTIKINRLAKRQKESADARFRKFIGGKPNYIDVMEAIDTTIRRGITATGIAYRDGRLFVLENGIAAEIPWSRIRRWKWNVEGYSQTVIHGVSLDPGFNRSVESSNANERYEAYKASGFMVEVSDVEHPRWLFQSDDEATLRKWFEILTQMNDGQLKAA